MASDSELLARFARSRSEDAFTELVQRYVNLVYSAALRQVGGDEHLAQDVAQTVFSDLARKAPALARRATLTGWLYTSARFTGAEIVRAEHRRRDREEEFMREPNEALTQQIAQLRADNESLSSLAAQAKIPALRPSDQFDELLRLRGEVGMLRQRTNELARFRQENRKLLAQVAAQSESTNQVSAEDQFTLRQTHAVDAMTVLLNAVKNYATNHNGLYPENLDQLAPSGDLGPRVLPAISDWMILNSRKTARWTRKARRSFSASGFPFKGPGCLRL